MKYLSTNFKYSMGIIRQFTYVCLLRVCVMQFSMGVSPSTRGCHVQEAGDNSFRLYCYKEQNYRSPLWKIGREIIGVTFFNKKYRQKILIVVSVVPLPLFWS